MPIPALAIPVASAAIGAIGGVVQNAVSNSANNSAIEKNQEFVRQMNEYNSPSNQRLRFEQAGFNPYLAIGSINGGNQVSAVNASPADTSGIGAGFANATANFLAASQMRASIAKTNAETKGLETDNLYKEANNKVDLQQKQQLLLNSITQNAKTQSEISQLVAQTASVNKGIELTDAQIKSTLANARLTGISAEQQESIVPLFKQMYQLQMANTQMSTSTGYQNAVSNRINARTSAYNAETQRMDYNTRKPLTEALVNGAHWDNRLKAADLGWKPELNASQVFKNSSIPWTSVGTGAFYDMHKKFSSNYVDPVQKALNDYYKKRH